MRIPLPAGQAEPATLRAGRSVTVWQRYWLYQMPGLLVLGILAFTGVHWFEIPAWAGAAAVGAWLVKDIALYPHLKRAYEGAKPTGPDALAGRAGVAQGSIAPRGTIKVGAELWTAESPSPISDGQEVRVVRCEGMILHVEAISSEGVRGGD